MSNSQIFIMHYILKEYFAVQVETVPHCENICDHYALKVIYLFTESSLLKLLQGNILSELELHRNLLYALTGQLSKSQTLFFTTEKA